MTENPIWIQNPFGEKWLKEANQDAFSQQPSSAIFQQIYQNTFAKPDYFYIIAGSDSGLLPQYVLNHLEGDKRRFLFIEPDHFYQALQPVLNLPDPSAATSEDTNPKHIQIIPASQLNLVQLADQYPEYFQHNRFSIIRSLSVLDQTHPDYLALWEELLTQAKLLQFNFANLYSARKFINTQLYNLPFNITPVQQLEGCLKNKSVLLLGGGPTLDTGLSWIKQHRNQILIAAVGRIAKRLQNEGITPDFYVSVDPNDVSYDNSKWLTREYKPVLIHSNFAHPSLLAEYTGPHCHTDGLFPWETPLNPQNLFCSGPTVANTMMNILTFLKAQNIYLLGVDFCYGPQGETHESQSLEAQHGTLTHSSDLTTETYSGRKALTNTVFYDAIQAANHYASLVHAQTDTRFYQLGEESAKIEPIPLVSFQEIKLNSPEQQAEVTQHIHQALKCTPEEEKQKKHAFLEEIQTKQKLFEHIAQNALEGKETAEALFEDLDKLDEQTQKIVSLQTKLNSENYAWAQEFLYQYAVKNYADFLAPTAHGTDTQSQDEIKENLINYFTALEKTANDFLNALKEAEAHLQNHLLEYDRTQLEPCAAYWLERQQEGRIYVWLKLHQLTIENLSPQEKSVAQRLIKAYEDKLNNQQEGVLIKRLKTHAETLGYQLKALDEAVENKDKTALNTLINALEKMEGKRARSALSLAKGFLAQLEQDADTALRYFLAVEEKDMLPKALNQVTQIALERSDIQSALNAIEILTEYDDRYYITYADLLMAAGDPAGAIQLYDYYLHKHMEDYGVWLKAAKAAIAGHDKQAAHQCLTYISQHTSDPALLQEVNKLFSQLEEE